MAACARIFFCDLRADRSFSDWEWITALKGGRGAAMGKMSPLVSSARAQSPQGDALGPLDAPSAELMPLAKLMARELRLRNEIQIDEPRWMILLELFVALGEAREVPFMSAAHASSAPVSTAQRYIHDMVKAGLVQQSRSGADQRVTHVQLTEAGRDMVSQILARTQALRAR